MGTRPSIRRIVDDDGTERYIPSGPTESQLKKGKIPTGYTRPETITIKEPPVKKPEAKKKFSKRR